MRYLLLATLPFLALAGCNRHDTTGNTAVIPPGFHPPTALNRGDFYDLVTRRFARLDINHDLYLSPQEYPRRHRDTVAAFDTDHDGRVSKSEFVEGSMRLFDQADTNRDGVLTGEEKRDAWLDRQQAGDATAADQEGNSAATDGNTQ